MASRVNWLKVAQAALGVFIAGVWMTGTDSVMSRAPAAVLIRRRPSGAALGGWASSSNKGIRNWSFVRLSPEFDELLPADSVVEGIGSNFHR
jgi:hypothetical protein